MTSRMISIIIPVYNRSVFVAEAIESVRSQTYPNWELIIVDDGSTDDTLGVLENYAIMDSRIKILERAREPKGAPTCRNLGAELAKGDFLIFWDSDDLMAPWCVEERIRFMQENDSLDFGLFQLLDIDCCYGKTKLRYFTDKPDYLKEFLSFGAAWGTPAVIWRKQAFKLLGNWNEQALSWQDGEIHIRALVLGLRFAWGNTNSDGIIRTNHLHDSITYSIDPLTRLINRLGVSKDLMCILADEYKSIFLNSVKARIWFETYNWSIEHMMIVGEKALELSFFTSQEAEKFEKHYQYFWVIKSLPILRGWYYRKYISHNFKNYKFFPSNEFLSIDRENFIEKINSLKNEQKEKFISIIPQSLKSAIGYE